ncbi:hypothetical protein JT31_02550 [Cedecea neteri]|jgi:hypothetical protein|uniref:Uncharacterized protein n=1 Tax=Cedecea neteri TaxID=158822 RepID=A0A089PZ88_9ENTR|nr:hypothetical protein [Cedecea neteri]AIR03534.1 hypothetical protein JT31_02550 [Cedecea neteri]
MSKQEEIDFWPGYVDALMNLVLNLLFLSAIFAIAIFVLGMESSRLRVINADNKNKSSLENAAVNKEPYKSRVDLMINKDRSVEAKNESSSEAGADGDPAKASLGAAINDVNNLALSNQKNDKPSASSGKTLIVNVTSDPVVQNENVIDKVIVKKERDKLLAILYPKDTVVIDDEVKSELNSLFSQSFANNQKVLIWGVSSASSAVSNRLTYLRIMAVRNVLLDKDVPNKNISISIYGGKVDAAGGKIYILGTE